MSESVSDQDASVLGKRVHDGSPQKPEDNAAPGPVEDDDDEDDIGPMPMPADPSSNGGARKKRKGEYRSYTPVERSITTIQFCHMRSCTSNTFPQRTVTSRVSCIEMP